MGEDQEEAISLDAAIMVVLLELGGILTLIVSHKTVPQAFLGRRHFFHLSPDCIRQQFS